MNLFCCSSIIRVLQEFADGSVHERVMFQYVLDGIRDIRRYEEWFRHILFVLVFFAINPRCLTSTRYKLRSRPAAGIRSAHSKQ
jgi:hypothetical protein